MFMDDKDLIYVDQNGETVEVRYMPNEISDFVEGYYYIDIPTLSIYKYIGKVNAVSSTVCPIGCMCRVGNKIIINRREYKDDEEWSIEDEMYRVRYIMRRSDFIAPKSTSFNDILDDYMTEFHNGLNSAKDASLKVYNTGNVYVPEIKSTDDILARLIKNIILKKQVVLNDYKDPAGGKDYKIDNLRSGLNGTTKSTTIAKFLDWCNLLGLYWKIELFNDDTASNIKAPLKDTLVVAKDIVLTEDFGVPIKGIYKVPLDSADDPLKRLIKVAVIQKVIVPSDYRNKGSNPHLFNNMMSGLKRKSKMMWKYFMYWCEILDVTFRITITDGTNTEVADKSYLSYDNANIMNYVMGQDADSIGDAIDDDIDF